MKTNHSNMGTPGRMEFSQTHFGYDGQPVLKDISFSVSCGEIICILGPNGVGKTTLFKTILGFIPPISGEIRLNGKNIADFSPNEFAKMVAYVPQNHTIPFPYKVKDVVLFGRTVHLGMFQTPGRKDRRIALEAMELLDIRHLADRSFSELSGGERQMVLFARALAQEARFIILDEPTSNLDYGNQVRVIRKVNELKKQSVGILMATHSPDHAFMVASKVILINNGRLYKSGVPDSTLTPENLKKIYGIEVSVMETCDSGKVCVPLIHN
ncbi:ABC transporter ATP-binding protein [Parabacteroides sp. FAFU027]|uniref:ABC transporter ATP-binding protein n=1 Tax=Parabacteroides sp. FAFU027 TaxID=2922715 RepID=UPI001FAF0934|nr:ABC transporter ATP-binding protein [Parabacteroides sp. FAFU027]